jgi:hypothetical protein
VRGCVIPVGDEVDIAIAIGSVTCVVVVAFVLAPLMLAHYYIGIAV